MAKLILTSVVLIGLIGLAGIVAAPIAPPQLATVIPQEANTQAADLELAQRYVPVFYFHPEEVYLPQPVEVTLSKVRLRQNRRLWLDTNILNSPTAHDLFSLPCDETCFLDQWFGDAGSSEFSNYTSHQTIYESTLSIQAGGPAPVTYAHVVHDENPNHMTIQYWVFYFYQDWFNAHEGDWEMVEVILTAAGQPEWVVYSQHHGGTRRSWETAPLEEGTHPAVFVARGSHANYFFGNEVYPNGQDVGNQSIDIMDRTGTSGRLVPEVILIPTRAELAVDPGAWPGAEWLMFRGRWGETAPEGDFNGPYGPADKGSQWEQPFAWGLSQPLDQETWYKNRLKVELARPEQGQDQIWLTDEDEQTLTQVENFGSLALLHADPPDKVVVHVQGMPGTRWGMTISLPDPATDNMIQMHFLSFEVDDSRQAQLEISTGQETSQPAERVVTLPQPGSIAQLFQVNILSGANFLTLQPSKVETFKATWDAPDLVWVGDILPFQDISGGFFIALLYSLAPTLIFVAILNWVNRYRKEPVRMLAIAFLWGSIPALIVALTLELFLKLPLHQIGTNALEAIRLGVMAPVLEEVLKAVGVLIIFKRFRREINDVLDGMVYGAMVGFGFAMTANLLRYIGNFLTWGYPALNSALVVERTIHALDHGLFTAIFGAGLGFALTAKNRRQFWGWVVGALGLAIATHALRNLLADNLVGMNVFTVTVTVSGTLVLWIIAGWSLVKQRRLMQKELEGQIHESLYYSVLDPLTRAKAQWSALRQGGFGAWRKVRQLQGLCIKLANTRLQIRLFPEKINWPIIANALQAEIKQTLDGMYPVAR